MNTFPGRRRAHSDAQRYPYVPAQLPTLAPAYADPRKPIPPHFHAGLGVGGPTGGFNGPIPMFPGAYPQPGPSAATWGYSPHVYMPQPFPRMSDEEDEDDEDEALEGISTLLADQRQSIFRSNPYADTLQWDVRQSYEKAASSEFEGLPAEVSASRAFQPKTGHVRILCKDLPWSFTVEASSKSRGVTIGDVLRTIYGALHVGITESEYWLATEDARKRMTRAYRAAVTEVVPMGGVRRLAEDGVLRVDYLGNRTVFAGLHHGDKSDAWVKTRITETQIVDDVYVLRLTSNDR